jgi:hypothetical protein
MNVIDFATDVRWRDVFYDTPPASRIKELKSFIRNKGNDWVSLYHGTSHEHPIMTKGLLPTSPSRRKSLQSAAGFVYLSVFPGMAAYFGKLAYPGRQIIVYKATICFRRLQADIDQLNNQRIHANRSCGNTLVESLVYGHGARVKGKIDPMYLTLTTEEQ